MAITHSLLHTSQQITKPPESGCAGQAAQLTAAGIPCAQAAAEAGLSAEMQASDSCHAAAAAANVCQLLTILTPPADHLPALLSAVLQAFAVHAHVAATKPPPFGSWQVCWLCTDQGHGSEACPDGNAAVSPAAYCCMARVNAMKPQVQPRQMQHESSFKRELP